MALNPNQYHATAGQATRADIDEGLRSYMLRVYNYMAMGVGLTGVIVMVLATNVELMATIALGPAKWIVFFALLGMGFMSGRIVNMKSVGAAHAFYWVYCALWGVLISPMIYVFLNSPGGVADIGRAFFITAGMFAGVSLLGYTTKKNLSGMATFLTMAILGMILIGFVQMIFFEPSTSFSLLFSVVIVLLFAGMTAFETQMIKNMYMENMGDAAVTKFALFGALQLYGSFVVMFIHILNILGIMRSE